MPRKIKSFRSYAAHNASTRVYRRRKPNSVDKNLNDGTTKFDAEPIHSTAAALPLNVDLMSLCEEGKVKEAIELMGQGVVADYDVFCGLLDGCGDLKLLEMGKKAHELLKRSSFGGDVGLNEKLIEMYGKCGSVRDARRVFDRMRDKNVGTWHLMIEGYAMNGQGGNGLLLFEEMKDVGLQPNEETFLAVFDACASAGAVEEGLLLFQSMKSEYGIVPGLEHYLGVLDVLGNAGYLSEAEEFVERMPIDPTIEIAYGLISTPARQNSQDHQESASLRGLSQCNQNHVEDRWTGGHC